MSHAVADHPIATPAATAERVVLHGITWDQYLKLDTILADEENCRARLTYLDGALEIISPFFRHEDGTSHFTYLLGVYFEEKGIEFVAWRSTTLREEGTKSAGGEADESYSIGEKKEFPDLAIEVTISSGGINKLEFYRRIGVPEVWFWKDGKLTIYSLGTSGYTAVPKSVVLPDLDIDLLLRCTKIPKMLQAMRTFREGLRK